MKLKIQVKRLNKNVELPKVIKKGEWVDLRSAKDVKIEGPQSGVLKYHMFEGEKVGHREVTFSNELIPLGVAMQLPKGFEAHILPRSSTFKNFGIIMANMQGVVDNSYCGDNDEWMFNAIALRDCIFAEGERICQFRIQLSQKATVWQKLRWLFSSGIKIVEVESLSNQDRKGFGSTGVK